MSVLSAVREWAKRIERDVVAVYYAARDPQTPLAVRLLAFAVAAYALSPIDLIPDFIPVIGYLDDLVIVPLGLMLVLRLLPAQVLESSREKAAATLEKPRSPHAAVFIVAVWVLCAVLFVYWLLRK